MLLNRSGYESFRNKAKAWRPPRITKNGQIHELDCLRLGSLGQSVNSTGCIGVKSSGNGIGKLSILVRRSAPGARHRSIAKRKNVCRLYCASMDDIDKKAKTEVYKLRAALLTYKAMSGTKFPTELQEYIDECTKFLLPLMSQEEEIQMFRQDLNRVKSTQGMMRVGFKGLEIKSLKQRINQAKRIFAIKL